MIKVAVSQRIIPHYRVPVFRELSQRNGIDLNVFYGEGFNSGTEVNAANTEGFKNRKLFTVKLPFKLNGTKRLFVIHPTLFIYLVAEKYDVVITEPTTNIFNIFSIYFYCKLFNKKFIWHEAGGVRKEVRSKKRKILDPFIRLFINGADAFLSYNSYAEEYLIISYGTNPHKIFRAQNALDTSEISREVLKFSDKVKAHELAIKYKDFKKILFIGALDKRKKVNNLISACSLLNQKKDQKILCMIVGDGPDLDFIKNQCSEAEKKFTLFLGKKIEDSVLYIILSDVVVLPGQGGLSINHSLACGKPIIATEEAYSPYTKSVYDYITNDINGMVAKTDNIEDLASKIYYVIENEERYKEFCDGAIKTSKKLSIVQMVDGYESAINYVMNNENTSN